MVKSFRGLKEVQDGNFAINSDSPSVWGLRGIPGFVRGIYLHVPIHPNCRSYFRFCYGSHRYQYRALPFGLTAAPRVFTKILVAAVAHLRLQGVYLYLDDVLICSPSREQAHMDVLLTVQTLQRLGFILNFPKSSLTLTQSLEHLGLQLDTLTLL